jgi:hypothetical protein
MTPTARAARRRVLRTLSALAAGVVFTPWTAAQGTDEAPPEIRAALPGARLQGQMRFRWLGFTLYDTRLWVAGEPIRSQDYATRPFALELLYARSLDGARIADRSIDEMRRIDRMDERQAGDWRSAMAAAFPDVVIGDRLTGLHQPGRGARFFHNARPTREVADTEFARLFFGIWLSPHSPEPALRQALLGGVG